MNKEILSILYYFQGNQISQFVTILFQGVRTQWSVIRPFVKFMMMFAVIHKHCDMRSKSNDIMLCSKYIFCQSLFLVFFFFFTVGGWTPTAASCAVERFYPFYNEWRTVAPMLKRCGDVAVCSLGGLIFTVGGRNDITSVSSVEK